MAVDDQYTELLLHMDGDNNSTTFVDESGKTVTRTGNAVLKTAVKKFGSASAIFDGNDYLAVSGISFGTGPFTIDYWLYCTTTAGASFSYGGTSNGFALYTRTSASGLYAAGGFKTSGGNISLNTWQHIAIVGNGAADGSRNIKIYLDGTLVGTWTTNYNYSLSVVVGTNGSYPSEGFKGYIDEVRVSLAERWTSDFTPATEPYAPPGFKASGFAVLGPYVIPELIGTPQSSEVNWTADVPADTTVVVKSAIVSGAPVDGDFEVVENAGSLPSLTQESSGKNLYFKVELETEDTAVTPSITALSVTILDAENLYRIKIALTVDGRMKHPQGDVSLKFTGTLYGPDDSVVEPFEITMLPENLVLFFNPADYGHVDLVSAAINLQRIQVFYSSHDHFEDTSITLLSASVSVIRTHIDDLET